MPPVSLALLSAVRPYLIGRYVIASAPALAILAAVGAASLVSALASKVAAGGRAPSTAIAALLLTATLATGQVALAEEPGHAWDEAAGIVAERSRPGDALLLPLPMLRVPFEASWRDLDITPPGPVLINSGRPLGEVRRLDSYWRRAQIETAVAEVDRLWVVHATDPDGGDRGPDDVLAWPLVERSFDVVSHDHLAGGVQVLLLERR